MGTLKPGLYPGMPAPEYHAYDNLSSSGLVDMLDCPLAYYRKHLAADRAPFKSSEAMVLGSVLHELILEPDNASVKIVPDVKRNTKDGKAAWLDWCNENAPGAEGFTKRDLPAELNGSYLLDDGTYTSMAQIAEYTVDHPVFKSIDRDKVDTELSFAWDSGGVLARGRCDLLTKDGLVVDVKTKANPLTFERDVYNYKLPVQAAWYMEGLAANDVDVSSFVWAVVERTFPHPIVALYACDDEMLEWGKAYVQKAKLDYRDCREADRWPGPSERLDGGVLVPEITRLSLPPWARDPYGERWGEGKW